MGTKRRVRRDWPAVLASQATSGEDAVTFCQREGIRPDLFRRWRLRLGQGPLAPVSSMFVQVGPVAAVDGGSSGVTVVTDRGWRVELAPGFDAVTLERVLACGQVPTACSG